MSFEEISMEFRGGGGQDEGMGGYNPSTPIKNSAFSKPALSPSSTLLISPRGFPHPGGARNGNCAFEVPSSSSPLNPLHSRALDSSEPPPVTTVQYKECLRNHAASIGGHVVDGCGEFMPGSGDDAMKCDACGCHRSFHRKDSYADNRVPLLLPPPPPSSATESSSEELNAVMAHHRPSAVASASASAPRKRFRTKFTAEQKERMLGFAESVGWRIQRQDEATVEQFCAEVGVKRQVLKVWMHNNKHSIRRHLHHHPHQQQQQQQQQQQHQQEQEQEQEQAQDQDQDQQQTQQQQQMQED